MGRIIYKILGERNTIFISARTKNAAKFIGIHLDYGTNDGYVASKLFKQTKKLFAADIKNKIFSENRDMFDGFLMINRENSKIELIEDEYFDSISCIHVLEHIEKPNLVVNEFYRLLKKGGIVYIETPNDRSLFTPSLTKGRTWNFYDDVTHIRPYSKASLIQLAKDSGFEIIDSGIYREIKYAVALPIAPILSLLMRDIRPLHYSLIHAIGWSSYVLCRKQ